MLLLLVACHAPDPDVDAPSDDSVADLTAELGVVETVVHVRWRTGAPTRATVTATGADVDPVEIVEAEAATDHDVVLAGFPARTDLTVAVTTDAGDEADTTISTGELPTWLPDVTLTANEPALAAGGFTVTSIIDGIGGGVVVYDGAGRPVWAHQRDEEKPGSVIRARLAADGAAMLYDVMASGVDAPGLIVRVPLDGSTSTDLTIAGTHTDFVELPTGGYAALGWELRTFGDREIVGDTIVEVDAAGGTEVVWSAFDAFTPDLSRRYDNFLPDNPDAEDWTHINGLAFDPVMDAYFVSITGLEAVARINRDPDGGRAALAWWLSDGGGDFARIGDTPLVSRPHSVQPTPEGLVVFNRGNPSSPDTCSMATNITLDHDAGTAESTWSYASERCLLVAFLGSAQRLDDGNTLVSWSTAGQLDEVTPDGTLAWRVSSAVGAGFGFAERVPVLGPLPAGP